MRATLLLPVLMLAGTSGYGQTIGYWTFDRSDTSLVEAPAVGVPQRLSGRPARYSDDVPGAFIYDPLTRQSRANGASAVFGSDERSPEALAVDLDFSRAGLAGQSVTIECFVKPDASARGDAWLAGKSRATEAARNCRSNGTNCGNTIRPGMVPPMRRPANGPHAGRQAIIRRRRV